MEIPNPVISFTRYFGTELHPETVALIRELGFVRDSLSNAARALGYTCVTNGWKLRISSSEPEARGFYEYVEPRVDDNVEYMLRRDGFPVDSTLRLRRLRALIEPDAPNPPC